MIRNISRIASRSSSTCSRIWLQKITSNDPSLADEYLERVKAMYYRSRNFTCVIAYALGNPSGNGYNMYKAYEWLKSVETARPVIYADAAGEWNTDL